VAQATVSLPDADQHRVEVVLSAQVRCATAGPAEVFVLPADVAVAAASLDGATASLSARGGALWLSVPAGGTEASLSLTDRSQVTGTGRRAALVPLPPVPSTSVSLVRGGAQGPVFAWPSGPADPNFGSQSTFDVPAGAGLALVWGGAHAVSLRSASYAVELEESGDSVQVTAQLEVHVEGPSGEVVVSPEGVAILSLSEKGQPLAARLSESQTLAVLSGVGLHRVDVVWRQLVDRSQGQPEVVVDNRAAIGELVFRASGSRDVRFEPPVPSASKVEGEGAAARTEARASLPPAQQVSVRWTETRTAPETDEQFNVETYQLVRLEEGALRSRVAARYDVLRGGVKELRLGLPDPVVVYRVNGAGIEDWRTFPATDQEPRHLRVVLGEKTTGSYALDIELEQLVPRTESAALAAPILRPLGAFRESGVIALIDGEKVAFAPAEASTYSTVGEDALPADIRQGLRDRVGQAFKHIGEPGPISAKVVPATQREVRFDSRVHTLFTVKEGAVLAQSSVQVEVKSGRVSELELSLPEGATVLSLSAPSLNKTEPAGPPQGGRTRHRVLFTQALEGALQIDLEVEQLLPRDLGTVTLPDLQVVGPDVEEGALGIAAETGIEVQAEAAENLRKVDASELPRAIRLRTDREVLLGYHYTRAPWKLGLLVKRLETVETIRTVVSPVRAETSVLADGHIVSRVAFDVKNDDRPFLRLSLPVEAGAVRVWSVRVGGAPVKVVRDDTGALAVPLPRAQTTRVELTYEVVREALGWTGQVALALARPDALATDIQWLLHLPRELSITGVDTAMLTREPGLFGGMPALGADEVALPKPENAQILLFQLAVQSADDPAAALSLSYLDTPGPAAGAALAVFSLTLLSVAVWRRVRRRSLGALGATALALGLASGAAYAGIWGVSLGEAVLAVGVLLAVLGAGWLATRQSKEAA
jgi:hypothetical protein